jgi:hypothetical protein
MIVIFLMTITSIRADEYHDSQSLLNYHLLMFRGGLSAHIIIDDDYYDYCHYYDGYFVSSSFN